MATYLRLTRLTAEADTVTYRYSADDRVFGRIALRTADGETCNDQPIAGDDDGRHYLRAAAKLRQAWRAGEFPELLEFAS